MKLLKEFKDFAVKGNVMDMAVGVVIGTAFGKIVASLVSDVIMPPFGVLLGGIKFSDHKLVLQEAVGETAAITLNWGTLVDQVVNFVIVAFSIFLVVKILNQAKRKEAAAPTLPPLPSAEEKLLTEIRDLLKK